MMNNWSSKLQSITPGSGQYNLQHKLVAGWTGTNFAEAGEIIRYTYSGWSQSDITRYENMLRNVFYPLVSGNPPNCPNSGQGCQFQGAGNPRASNQEASWGMTQMAIGVFLNDSAKFQAGVDRYNWLLPRYVDTTGESNETCRDQGHTQMGLGDLVQSAEIGRKQGVDLYAALNNRLATGLEYTAKVITGVAQSSHCGTKSCASCDVYPMWEVGYNHYHNRRGLSMSNSLNVLNRMTKKPGSSSSTQIPVRPHWLHFTSQMAWQTLTHAELP